MPRNSRRRPTSGARRRRGGSTRTAPAKIACSSSVTSTSATRSTATCVAIPVASPGLIYIYAQSSTLSGGIGTPRQSGTLRNGNRCPIPLLTCRQKPGVRYARCWSCVRGGSAPRSQADARSEVGFVANLDEQWLTRTVRGSGQGSEEVRVDRREARRVERARSVLSDGLSGQAKVSANGNGSRGGSVAKGAPATNGASGASGRPGRDDSVRLLARVSRAARPWMARRLVAVSPEEVGQPCDGRLVAEG